MRREGLSLLIGGVVLVTFLSSVGGTFAGEVVSEFVAKPLFKAVELSWKVERPADGYQAFILARSNQAGGPYTPFATIPYDPKTTMYHYRDRDLGPSDLYYYTLTVQGTGETYGPVSARAYFFPPA